MRRSVITGIGIFSPWGCSFEDACETWLRGEGEFSPIKQCDVSGSRMQMGGQVEDLSAKHLPNRKLAKLLNRKDQLALAAAKAAIASANLQPTDYDPQRAGAYVGSSSTQFGDFFPYFDAVLSCVSDDHESFDSAHFGSSCLDDVNPLAAVKVLMNGALAHICAQFNLQGPNSNILNSTTSGLQCLQYAKDAIEDDMADLCLFGATFAPFDPFQIADAVSFKGIVEAPADIRPYDKNRRGSMYSECSIFMVLEQAEHAAARGVDILAQVDQVRCASSGRGSSHKALKACLEDIITPASTFVLGCGYGDESIDREEMLALSDFDLSISSLHATTGYVGEVTSMLQIAQGIQTLSSRQILPTRGLDEEEIHLSFVRTPTKLNEPQVLISTLNGSSAAAARISIPEVGS